MSRKLPAVLALLFVACPAAFAQIFGGSLPPIAGVPTPGRTRTSLPTNQPTIHHPDVPSTDPSPDFPLKVRLYATHWTGPLQRPHGFGSGNIEAPGNDLAAHNDRKGFDYTFECKSGFVANRTSDDLYQARWKKASWSLELLMLNPDTNKEDICELKVALKARAYELGIPIPTNRSWATTDSFQWLPPDVAFTAPDTTYPVRLRVLTSEHLSDRSGPRGKGVANLLEASPQALDFTHGCARGFLANSQRDEYYQGRWIIPDQKLEILLQRTGEERVDKCLLETTLKDGVYDDAIRRSCPSPMIAAQASLPCCHSRGDLLLLACLLTQYRSVGPLRPSRSKPQAAPCEAADAR